MTNSAKKAAQRESKRSWRGYVQKDTYDQTEQQRKQLETSVNDYKTQLETTAGGQCSAYPADHRLPESDQAEGSGSSEDITDLKLTNAIKLAISASAQDSDLVAGLVDRRALTLGDDEAYGLDEQVKALKESKPFLFKRRGQSLLQRKASS